MVAMFLRPLGSSQCASGCGARKLEPGATPRLVRPAL